MTIELAVLTTVSYQGRDITAPRLRSLIALLARDLRTGCGTARLIEELWPDERPGNPAKALQILVSRARARLGADTLVSTPTGYRLALGAERVDAAAVLLHSTASAEKSRAGDHAGSVAEAEAGLELWGRAEHSGAEAPGAEHPEDRDPGGRVPGAWDSGVWDLGSWDPGGQDPLPAGPGPADPLAALRAARAPVRRALLRARALGLARGGRRAEALAPLTGLARALPRDEELLLELLRCQAATTGRAAALETYERYRAALRDGLGTDPGTALRALHQELLRGEAPKVRRGVPYEPNPLLGRDADVAAVIALLRTSRVTSIVGPGGLGKTRLAGAVGREAEQRVVHLVPLAAVTDDADVAGEVAAALGAGESLRARPGPVPAHDTLTAITGALGGGPVLLILDNCEQVVTGVAELVSALVARVRELRVLTTGRAPLGLSSESVHPLPELDAATTVALFEQRARAARPGVTLDRPAVAGLCRRLDGLPLAVELAAARVRVMPVPEIARRLEDRFTLLRGGARDAPRRHRTLHAVVDWSWNLLEPAGRAALRTLSVLPGGFTAETAEHLLRGHERFAPDSFGAPEVLEVLTELVDQSLLKLVETPWGGRFRMLETVREFSALHRERAGEETAVRARFLDWARDFGLAHHEEPFTDGAVGAWRRVRAEQDNLVRALRIALAQDDDTTAVATAAVLSALWTTETDCLRLSALAQDTGPSLTRHRPGPEAEAAVRTLATTVTATLLLGTGTAPPRFLSALRRLPPTAPTTPVRALATVLAALPGAPGTDHDLLDSYRHSDQPLLVAAAEGVAGYVWERENEPERAMESARRTLAALGDHPAPWPLVMARSRIGELCLRTERGAEALERFAGAMATLDRLGDWNDLIGLRWGMVLGSLQTGDADAADHWRQQALLHDPESGGDAADVLTPDLGARAEIALARGETERGLELWRRAVVRCREGAEALFGGEPALAPWSLEIRAVTVAAHAWHGRVDAVADLAAALPEPLTALLGRPAPAPGDLPACGALLLALGAVDLDRARRGAGPGAAATGVRLIALADRFHCPRTFQPTMSSARARAAAEAADRAAHAAAVTAYAALDRDALPGAALALLAERE
ncbi:ATP-binding protein [Streptomyces sp. NPDC057638]|uniref:ATP-binding protein n=1 Tax=Streptomyces sp. NPDC057638 TaxID=3346190 RepID=UPI00368EC4F5